MVIFTTVVVISVPNMFMYFKLSLFPFYIPRTCSQNGKRGNAKYIFLFGALITADYFEMYSVWWICTHTFSGSINFWSMSSFARDDNLFIFILLATSIHHLRPLALSPSRPSFVSHSLILQVGIACWVSLTACAFIIFTVVKRKRQKQGGNERKRVQW